MKGKKFKSLNHVGKKKSNGIKIKFGVCHSGWSSNCSCFSLQICCSLATQFKSSFVVVVFF